MRNFIFFDTYFIRNTCHVFIPFYQKEKKRIGIDGKPNPG